MALPPFRMHAAVAELDAATDNGSGCVYSKLLLAFRIKSLGTYGRLMFRNVSTQPVASVPQFSRGEISKAQNRLVLATCS